MAEKNKLVKICWKEVKEHIKDIRKIATYAASLKIHLDFLSKKIFVLEVMEKEDYE